MKFPNLHIKQTTGKLPDTLSRNTPSELITKKTTMEVPQNIKTFLAKDKTSPRSICNHALKTDCINKQLNKTEPFSIYLDCQENDYEVD